uniref:Ceramide synthase longevity assurance homolog n=1 Tax=Echinococcus granulosus TaxID=6210 RepID=A0A068WVI6_ECHGR|nr:ceramide synthase longevity assurance homolog [Echinococcus granulosus]
MDHHDSNEQMSTDEQASLKERLKTYPVEPFDRDTNVFPYYVIFTKDNVKVRVPIALDSNAYRCVQENSPLFLEKLKDQLFSKFPEASSEKTPVVPKLDSKKSYILVSDTSKKDVTLALPSISSMTNSLFDEMVNFRREFRRIRCFYGLTYDDVAQSILNCYKVDQSAYMLYRLEMCSLTAWKHSQELALIRRWVADMKTPKQRARLFPPRKLKQSLLMRYEKLAAKSVTFTKDQQEKLEKFYLKKKKPSNEDLRELKEQLGLQVWKMRYWLRERSLNDENA